MSEPDIASDKDPMASRYDAQITAYQEQIKKLEGAPPPDQTPEQRAATRQTLFQEVAHELGKRHNDLLEQSHIIAQLFSDPLYNANHWRKVSWIDTEQLKELAVKTDPQAAAPQLVALPMQHLEGGKFTVRRDEVTFDDDRASRNVELLTTGMLHVKTAWGGAPIEVNGTKEFKEISWALAEIHGVKVTNFAPEGAATMSPAERETLARGILVKHKEDQQAATPQPQPQRPAAPNTGSPGALRAAA